ncbi:MAG: hypothetical protein ABFR62_07480 [Bacteroidota bacterium]
MKRLVLLLSSIMLLSFPNYLSAQDNSKYNAEQQAVLDKLNQWHNEVMINKNLDVFEGYHSKNTALIRLSGTKVENVDLKQMKAFVSNNEGNKYTKISYIGDPYVYVSKEGDYAWIYYTAEYEYINSKDNSTHKYTSIFLDMFLKEDGQWVAHADLEQAYDERKTVAVDKKLLDEYTGTYYIEKYSVKLFVTNDGRNLIFKPEEGNEITVLAQADDSFYIEGKPGNIVFGRDKNGKVSHYYAIRDNTFVIVKKIN